MTKVSCDLTKVSCDLTKVSCDVNKNNSKKCYARGLTEPVVTSRIDAWPPISIMMLAEAVLYENKEMNTYHRKSID